MRMLFVVCFVLIYVMSVAVDVICTCVSFVDMLDCAMLCGCCVVRLRSMLLVCCVLGCFIVVGLCVLLVVISCV